MALNSCLNVVQNTCQNFLFSCVATMNFRNLLADDSTHCTMCEKVVKRGICKLYTIPVWGGARGEICGKCAREWMKDKADPLYRFKENGRFLYYSTAWVLMFRNPHGHHIFDCHPSDDPPPEEEHEQILKVVDDYFKVSEEKHKEELEKTRLARKARRDGNADGNDGDGNAAGNVTTAEVAPEQENTGRVTRSMDSGAKGGSTAKIGGRKRKAGV